MTQNLEIHPSLKQHRIHLWRKIHFKFYIKKITQVMKFETLIRFTKNKIKIFQMNGQRISFKRVTFVVPLFKNTKETFFFTFKNAFKP
jgi:hypothetical protein